MSFFTTSRLPLLGRKSRGSSRGGYVRRSRGLSKPLSKERKIMKNNNFHSSFLLFLYLYTFLVRSSKSKKERINKRAFNNFYTGGSNREKRSISSKVSCLVFYFSFLSSFFCLSSCPSPSSIHEGMVYFPSIFADLLFCQPRECLTAEGGAQ